MKEIWFDMDGTIADLYGVENWLADLLAENERPYATAKPLINFSALARVLNNLQKKGYKIGIISWLCKDASENYDNKVIIAKQNWLKKHLPSVNFDRIEIVKYGTYKEVACGHSKGILFDDEENNRKYWNGIAYDEKNIIDILKGLRV